VAGGVNGPIIAIGGNFMKGFKGFPALLNFTLFYMDFWPLTLMLLGGWCPCKSWDPGES
jgi:hypothetical protein